MKSLFIRSTCRITEKGVSLNGINLKLSTENDIFLSLYKSLNLQYPKYFKMDKLCKSGFLASECILQRLNISPEVEKKDWAVIIANRASSLDDDISYFKTIKNAGNYFPSPSVFVYTLPNIVTGEISIRQHIHSETSCYVHENFDSEQIETMIRAAFVFDETLHFALCGWVDYFYGIPDVMLYLVSDENAYLKNADLKQNLSKELVDDYYKK